MKILFIASDNNKTSGAFLSMVKLNQLLISEYGISTFVVLPNDGDGDSLLKHAGIPFEIIPSRNWIVDIEQGKTKENELRKELELVGNKDAIDNIVKVINREKIDIVHINTSYSYVGAIAAIQSNHPFVWHIREFLREDQNRKIWNEEKGHALMGKAAALIAISNSIYKKYAPILPNEKLKIIYNGIDENVFYQGQKEIFKDKKLHFMIIGGVLPYKGQEELIAACELYAKREKQEFDLKIIGKCKEEYLEYIKQLIMKKKLEKQVVLLGARDDVPELLKQTDVLFVCSRNEAFGRTTVEGMMSGCLVVGADTAGTKELIEDGVTGYLYHKGDIEHLYSVIQKACSNIRKSKKISKKGREEAMKKYTAMRNAEEVYELYQRIM